MDTANFIFQEQGFSLYSGTFVLLRKINLLCIYTFVNLVSTSNPAGNDCEKDFFLVKFGRREKNIYMLIRIVGVHCVYLRQNKSSLGSVPQPVRQKSVERKSQVSS